MAIQRRMLLAAAVGAASGPKAWGAATAVPFAPAMPNGLPSGFSVGLTGGGPPPIWSAQPASGNEGAMLTQTGSNRTDYRFPLAIYDGVVAADIDATVRFMAVSGKVDRAAGLAVRLIDAQNYYVVRANALEDNVNFYRVTAGSRTEIRGAVIKVTAGVWHTLGLRAMGDRFTVSFDGAVLFVATDRGFPAAGKIALWTKADSITQFAGLSIETP